MDRDPRLGPVESLPPRAWRGTGQTPHDQLHHRPLHNLLIVRREIGIAEAMPTKEGDGLEHEAGGDRGIRDLSELAGADTSVDVLTQPCQQAAPHMNEEEREELWDVEGRPFERRGLESRGQRSRVQLLDNGGQLGFNVVGRPHGSPSARGGASHRKPHRRQHVVDPR